MLDRERAGREASPSAVVIDAQSVRSGGVGVAGERGYDAAKKVVGRKRHAMVDTDGRLLMNTASTASIHDSHGGVALLGMACRFWPFVERCFADKAYAGKRVATASPSITVELVGAAANQRGFAVQPRRWVVERTLATPTFGSPGSDAAAGSPATTKPPSHRASPSQPSPPP